MDAELADALADARSRLRSAEDAVAEARAALERLEARVPGEARAPGEAPIRALHAAAPVEPGARERARAARDDVWAWALTSSPHAEDARLVAEQIDGLLEDAARLESDGDAGGAATVYARVVSLAVPAVQAASRTRLKRRR